MTQNKQEQRTAYIVSHSHWDREWRYSLWETRFMLLDWFDDLVDLIENEKLAGFLTDGQVAPVLDYLEIRPQMAERVKKLISEGKLEIGPWLYLPDEYPVDGEALVRNLLWGHRKCKELGGICKTGYTPFGWGQTAQLPQIYAGFDIDTAFLSKRVRPERAPQSEFLWLGPDGTQILTSRFGEGGRGNFFGTIHLLALTGMKLYDDQWEYHWDKGGTGYHRADPEKMEQDHFQLDAPKEWLPEKITQDEIDKLWATTDESVIRNHRAMMDGYDYTYGDPLLHEIIEKINEVDSQNRTWKHTTFMEYVHVMKEKIDRSKLKIVKGELRDGPVVNLTGNALATRYRIKKHNKLAQNKLIRAAEPMTGYATFIGAEYPKYILDQAWSNLLQAHPHDSINGVSQDVTADDVMARLQQSIEISDAVYDRALKDITKQINLKDFTDEDVVLVVFNSLPYPRRQVIEAYVNVPGYRPKFKWWTRRPDDIMILDSQGNDLPTQWRNSEYVDYVVAEGHIRAYPFNTIRHQLYFDSGEIPAGGYKVFKVGSKADRKLATAYANSRESSGSLLKAPYIIENEYIKIVMNSNGTFNLTNKELAKTFYNLNYFEDAGQPGDYWINEKPGHDQVHTSMGCSARIWSQESGPLQSTLVSEIIMLLPADTDAEKSKRSDELKEFKIRTAVTIKKGHRQIDVNVDFDNCIQNHRLRAMFPTGLENCVSSDAGGHFCVDHRSVHIQGPAEDLTWPDMATLPQNNFVSLSDGRTGFAVLNDSLTEYEVLYDDDRTLALTLVRGVKNWICTEARAGSNFLSQKGGQQLGKLSYRYAIYTHKGNWECENLPLLAEFFNVDMSVVLTRKHQGNLPGNEHSFFQIDNKILRFSTLKKCEDRNSWIVRLYNPTSEKHQANLLFHLPIKKAWLTNLNEERQNEIKTEGKSVPVEAGPCKIVTIEIEL